MKRIYSHALAIFSLAFAYTKGTILFTLLYLTPTYATCMIAGLFVLFLFFIYWVTKNERVDAAFSWKNVAKTAILGTVMGYFMQIINICIYLKTRHIPINIGFFEDELYRSVVFLLPCLIVGELLYYTIRKSSWWSVGVGVGAGVCVLGACGVQLKDLLVVESVKAYPSVSKASKDKPNVILILADGHVT